MSIDSVVLQGFLGSPMLKAQGMFYVSPDGSISNTPDSVWLEFADGGLHLSTASDGWCLKINAQKPESFDMGDCGSFIVRDLSKDEIFRSKLDQVLIRCFLLQSPPGSHLVGLRMRFEANSDLFVLNWGDELFLGEGAPEDLKAGEFSEEEIARSSPSG